MLMILKTLEAATGGVWCEKVFRNFAKFTGKHLCQSLFFNKVAGLRPNTSGRLFLKNPLCKFKKQH